MLELLKRSEQFPAPRILEIGTGSGCIAVATAANLPASRITATDISDAALSIAAENAARHNVADRITFLQCDLCGGSGR